MIAIKAEAQASFVHIVAKGHEQQMKHEDELRLKARLIVELPEVAKDYGARNEVRERTLTECVRMVIKKFGHLSIKEIGQAYRMLATGELEVKGAEMYGGDFNAMNLGKTLAAYDDKRKKVLGIYLRERNKALEEEKREQMHRTKQQKFDTEFPLMIEEARAKLKDWREVPAYWYEAAKSRGLIEMSKEEAWAIFEDAKQLAELEKQEDRSGNTLVDILRKVEEKDENERAKVIARKLTVYRKLINP